MAESPFLVSSPLNLTLALNEDEEEIEEDPIPFWSPLHSWSFSDHPRSDPASLFPDICPDDADDDDFFICRRSSADFSRARPIHYSDPDPDPDDQIGGPPLCWDCLRIDEEDDVEWEQVAGDPERNPDLLAADNDGDVSRNIEWEVLLSVRNNNINLEEDAESYYIEDQEEGYIYTSEHDEVLFGQFADHDGSMRGGGPPAAKSAVENLPSALLKVGDCRNCAVCKDEIEAEEKARRLPCGHCYHEECILQWLGMRNTCPLCRFELPTDDAEYGRWKAQRRARYDFEMLPEA